MPSHKILLILPAWNEQGKIGTLVKKVLPKSQGGIVDEVLVVTDGNTDNTAQEAREAGATVIDFKERKGIGFAIRTGIDYAMQNGFDLCCIMGGDDQDEPSEIPRLVAKIDEGFEFVNGSRYLPGGRTTNQPLFRLVTTKLYTLYYSLLTFHWLTDSSNGFRIFKTDICRKISLWQPVLDGYELEPYLYFHAITRFKWAEAPVTKNYHTDKSYTKMTPFVDWFRVLKAGIKARLGLY